MLSMHKYFDEIFEMANFPPKKHKFNIGEIKLNIRQPGISSQYSHYVTIKIFKVGGTPSNEDSFYVNLPMKEKVVYIKKQPKMCVQGKNLKILKRKLLKYRLVFIRMWFDQGSDIDEGEKWMKNIDQNEEKGNKELLDWLHDNKINVI